MKGQRLDRGVQLAALTSYAVKNGRTRLLLSSPYWVGMAAFALSMTGFQLQICFQGLHWSLSSGLSVPMLQSHL